MMKKIWAAVCAAAMLMTGAALAETDVRVTALKGPTAMGMVELMNEAESGAVNGNAYDFTIASAVDEVSPKLVKGETDIAAVPANLAAVLYNNTEGQVEVLAVNTLGVLYIVESGDSIGSVEDLRGKTIYASGKGATPEYALNYILTENGIDPDKDVTIEWKSEHAECLAALMAEDNGDGHGGADERGRERRGERQRLRFHDCFRGGRGFPEAGQGRDGHCRRAGESGRRALQQHGRTG